MARVRTTQQLNVGYIRVLARPGAPIVRNLEARGLAVQAAAKQRLRQSPTRIDTGNLLNSIQVFTYYRGGFPVVRIGTDVEYAIYVHEGTRPHVIVPRNAQALRWQGPRGPVFAQRVMHPGMQANPFLRDGLIRAFRQF